MMKKNDISLIQDVLDFTVKKPRPPIGLNYVAYAVQVYATGNAGERIEIVNEAFHEAYLRRLLKRFAGPTEAPDQQIKLWKQLLPQLHATLANLDDELVKTGQGENVRAHVDTDMGGFYYTRINSHSFLFGATLDQAQINNGRCSREMQQMVSEIQAVFTAHGA